MVGSSSRTTLVRTDWFDPLPDRASQQIAKSLVRYGERWPDLQVSTFVIPQIPGSRRDSRNARGVLESLAKTKKYAIPIMALQPWLPAGFVAGYLATGRFDPERYATTTYDPGKLERDTLLAAEAD